MVNTRKVIWPLNSRLQLRHAFDHIKKDSLKNAEKVRKAIALSAKNLIKHPAKHPLDKFKTNNDGTFRAFELYHYRIAYRVTNSEIIIVRIRHTSMEPLGY